MRLLKTELRFGTAQNDVNAILSVQGGIPQGYLVWNYLTSSFAWFLKTDQGGLVHMDRVPYETDMSVGVLDRQSLWSRATCASRGVMQRLESYVRLLSPLRRALSGAGNNRRRLLIQMPMQETTQW